jgi:hypothetical protein
MNFKFLPCYMSIPSRRFNVMQPVTDADYEVYRYVIDFSMLISPVLCPDIHFAILFSQTLKARNEILRATNMTSFRIYRLVLL